MRESKIGPYRPIPFRDGNVVTRRYTSRFMDRVGNAAIITKVDYITSKSKLIEGYILYVKWNN